MTLGIDSKEGRIAYLVVSQEGMEGKVVPFSSLLKRAGSGFALNITKEQFAAAPAYRVQTAQVGWKPPYGLDPIAEYNWVVNWPVGR